MSSTQNFTPYQSYLGIKISSDSSEEDKNLERFKRDGFFVLENVIEKELIEEARVKIDLIWEKQVQKFGESFLKSRGEFGQVRCMLEEDPLFLSFVRHPVIFKYMSLILGKTSILHAQNGIVLHPSQDHNQSRFHKDFAKDFTSTKCLSINTLITVDAFSQETGGTWLVPGSHLIEEMPSATYFKEHEIQVSAPEGSVLIFDAQLWHRGGANRSNNLRRAINQQFTRPFIKQQIDYPALLKGKVDRESDVAQTLGFWSVSSKTLDEFRVKDPALRTYKANQG